MCLLFFFFLFFLIEWSQNSVACARAFLNIFKENKTNTIHFCLLLIWFESIENIWFDVRVPFVVVVYMYRTNVTTETQRFRFKIKFNWNYFFGTSHERCTRRAYHKTVYLALELFCNEINFEWTLEIVNWRRRRSVVASSLTLSRTHTHISK